MEIGSYNTLEVLRTAEHGYYLGDDEGNDVLLPLKWALKEYEIGEFVDVFVYTDGEDRPIATTMKPLAEVGDIKAMKVKQVSNVGAFLEWGLEKDLLVPYKEQPKKKLEEGETVLVFVYLDEVTNRVAATTRLHLVMENTTHELSEGAQVDLKVWKKTDLGYSVVVNNEYLGLLYHLDTFEPLHIGQEKEGFVKRIKKIGDRFQIDVSLRKYMGEMIEPDSQLILDKLKAAGGFLKFSDKSTPNEIIKNFNMSKKAFKRALGNLYKRKLINLEKAGISLIGSKKKN